MDDVHTYCVTFRAPGNQEPQTCEVTAPGPPLSKVDARQVVHLATGAPADMIRVLSVREV